MSLQTRLQAYNQLSTNIMFVTRVRPVTALRLVRANSASASRNITSHFPSYHQPSLRFRYSTASPAQNVTNTSVGSSLSNNLFQGTGRAGGKMSAQKIDGTALAQRIRKGLNETIRQKQAKNDRYKPSLVILQGN